MPPGRLQSVCNVFGIERASATTEGSSHSSSGVSAGVSRAYRTFCVSSFSWERCGSGSRVSGFRLEGQTFLHLVTSEHKNVHILEFFKAVGLKKGLNVCIGVSLLKHWITKDINVAPHSAWGSMNYSVGAFLKLVEALFSSDWALRRDVCSTACLSLTQGLMQFRIDRFQTQK